MLAQNELERERYEARVKYDRDERSRRSSALIEGRVEGKRIGVIQYLESELGRPPTPDDQLAALPVQELDRRIEELRNARSSNGFSPPRS